MLWGFEQVDGWFFSKKWNYYQKVQGNVVAYVQKQAGYYCLQLYETGVLFTCDVEYHTESHQEAFEKGLEFLEKYKDKMSQDMATDFWSPNNPQGYWQTVHKNK